MKSSALQAILWVLLIFCNTAHTQPQTKPAKKEPPSSVTGKVTIKGKGAPGIVVGMRVGDRSGFNAQWMAPFKATTDQDGNYRITNVVPGTYRIAPAAPAFVNSGEPGGKALIITAGETVEGIDFTLSLGGAITGRVTDSEGRPLIEEQITLLPGEGTKQSRAYMVQHMMIQTDDRGVYRMFGIPQGKYRVAVGQGEEGFREGPRRSQYRQTFHPTGSDASKAAVIEVSEGSETSNVDITVGSTLTTFTASGRIVDGETGKPLPNIKYGLQTFVGEQGATSSITSNLLTSDNQGEFKVENLTPGKYAVFIKPQANSELRADAVSFDLIDQDVSGLLLKTSRGASVSGVVVLEGTNDKVVLAQLTQSQIHVFVANEGPGNPWARPLTISPDGSFRIGGLESGMAHFSFMSTDGGPPRGFMLIRVERDGIAQARGVEIKEGEQLTGIKLVVAYGNGTIRGVVTVVNGELPPAAQIRVWLTNLGSRSVDSRGRFVVEGLPAGTYELNALVYIPESRNPPARAKQQVSVADGVVSEVTITVRLNPNPGAALP